MDIAYRFEVRFSLYTAYDIRFTYNNKLLTEEFSDSIHYVVFLDLLQFRKHWQCKACECCFFRYGEITLFVTKVGETLLEVQGDRIIYPGLNSLFLKERLELIPFLYPDHILVKNV